MDFFQQNIVFLVIAASLGIISYLIFFRGRSRYKRELAQQKANSNKQTSEIMLHSVTTFAPEPMMPENRVEQLLCSLRDLTYPLSGFLQNDLVNISLVFLTNEQPDISENSSLKGLVSPFMFQRDGRKYLALFTTAGRSSPTRPIHKGNDYALTLNAKALIEMIEGKYGIVINAGWDTELVIDQPIVQEIYKQILAHNKTSRSETQVPVLSYEQSTLQECRITDQDAVDSIIDKVKRDRDETSLFFQKQFPEMKFTLLVKSDPFAKTDSFRFPLSSVLTLVDQNDEPSISLFSQEAFAEEFRNNIPDGFPYTVEIPAKELLQTLPRGFGMVIDPNSDTPIPLPDSLINFYSHLMPDLHHRIRSEVERRAKEKQS